MDTLRLKFPKKTLIVPVGLPGSGKSTLLSQVLPHTGFCHGADDVRRTMFGDVSTQGNPWIVHEAARHMLRVRLVEGLPSAYDATNLTVRERQNLLVMADQNDYYVVALVGDVPIEVVKLRNEIRQDKVPEFVIDRMVKKREEPTVKEGFDEVVRFDQFTKNLRIAFTDY